ncbi:MAG: hypothetical protein WCH43_10320 [Verrucomicrobiota bacterium]
MKSIFRFLVFAALLFAVSGCGKKPSSWLSEKNNVPAEPTAQPTATEAEGASSGSPQPSETAGIRNAPPADPAQTARDSFPAEISSGGRAAAGRSPSGTKESTPSRSEGAPSPSMDPGTLIRQLDEYIARLSADAKGLSGKDREKAEQRIESLRQRLEQEKKDLVGGSQ